MGKKKSKSMGKQMRGRIDVIEAKLAKSAEEVENIFENQQGFYTPLEMLMKAYFNDLG